jgi:hypothetical protein
METPHSSFANQDRSVYSEKLPGIERVFEALDGLSRYVVAACGMDDDRDDPKGRDIRSVVRGFRASGI